MSIKSQLHESLHQLSEKLFGISVSFSVDIPENIDHGDYSTNIVLVLAKPVKKSPREVAAILKENLLLDDSLSHIVDKVEIAGPGFINFFLSKTMLINNLNIIEEKSDTFGTSDILKDKKIITEFTDPNPFKEFHIGHLYSNTVGESLSRLVASQGADVKRVCYQGDVGLHVAKAIWGLQKNIVTSATSLEELKKKSLHEQVHFLGQAYATGATAYEEDEEAKKQIIEVNKQIFAKDPEIVDLYETGKAWSLAYFGEIYARLGTVFDHFFFESEVGEDGKKLVLGYLEKGVFKESDGAVIFPGEEYGLHNRVFINSLGLPTYEAKELGLAPAKYEYFPYDQSIVITGNEIKEYFKVLLKALSLIRPELAEKTLHIGHGMVRLPEGKMSSRTGNVITGEWLLDEAKRRVVKIMYDSSVDDDKIDETAEKVGIAAVKYALLKSGIGGDIAFSFSESITFEGNSGPYLQYTFVRTQSILTKAQDTKTGRQDDDLALEKEEEILLRHLVHFPEIVAYAAQVYAPNLVCEYLYQLAQKFNLFYAKHTVIGSEQEQFRVLLAKSVGQTLENGLTLLGIPVVYKM